MRESSLIGHSIEVFLAFSKNPNIPADSIIREFFRTRKYLGSKDRKYIADTYFGAIKNYIRLESLIKDAFEVESAPYVLYIPAYLVASGPVQPEALKAALEELSDPQWKTMATEPFQRMADRHREIARLSALPIADRLSIAYSFPKWFVERLLEEYPNGESEDILSSLNDEAPTVLRSNTLKVESRDALQEELKREGCSTVVSKLAQDALVLDKRVNVFNLRSFKEGAFEMQDEASQLVAPFSLPKKTSKVLDACAGAGGKTLHFAALLENHGEIYATDIDRRKLEELKKRVRRSGAQNVRVVGPDQQEQQLKGKQQWFDVVLLDVPCSGTGTLRRNPSIKWVLTPQMLEELLAKQKMILEQNANYVKKGGVLLYATCSILKEEGEKQVERFLAKFPDFALEEILRTRPHQEGCDGFFAARLRRNN